MTSAPVSNPVDIMYIARNDNVQAPKGENDFAGSLKSAVEKSGQSQPENKKTEQTEKVTESPKQEDASESKISDKTTSAKQEDGKKTNVQDKKENLIDEMDEETLSAAAQVLPLVSENLEQSAAQVLDTIEELTGLDESDIVDAMEQLGLSMMDLLSKDNLATLLMEVNGTDDPMAIVTDENLYQSLQTLTTQVEELTGQVLDETGLDEKGLQEVMNLLEEQMKLSGQEESTAADTPVGEVAEKIETGIVLDTPVPTTKEPVKDLESETVTTALDEPETVDNTPVVQTAVHEESNRSFEENEASENSEEQPATDLAQQTKNTEAMPERETVRKQSEHVVSKEVTATEETPAQPVFVQQINETAEMTNAEAVTDYRSYVSDTQRIAEQIMDHMKVQMREGITELEMQLHPASLGNVNVSLISREGNITAQFTAQNDAVRNVIETQLVQLKEQFEEQGIKVDAVEVAVASHQFERQYEGEADRQSQRNTNGTKRTRRINLDDIDEEDISKLFDDAEKIQVDMMARNGNTVDFTV